MIKVGSLVEAIHLNVISDSCRYNDSIKLIKLNTPYTVSYYDGYNIGIKEVISSHPNGRWNAKRFRELLFPTNLEKEIEESLTRELVSVK